MPYVQRDGAGKVIGRFANKQPGYAEEFIEDGHNDLADPPPVDQADIDQLNKQMKALALTFAQITNTPVATVRTIFRNKMEQLP